MVYPIAQVLALTALLGLDVHAKSTSLAFDWEKLQPSSTLKWVECAENRTRECARLELPLNYADPDNEDKAIIAIMRIPSPLIGTDSYRGPILLNPGGPGGSGVAFVDRFPQIATIAGPEFDVVGFDPRGVARTRPRVSFYGSCEERNMWSGNAALNASSDTFAREYATSQLRNIMARDRDVNGQLRYITTDLVARDMLEITRAMGFEKLKYWGFSYGSVLGATYAAMFPDKIERLIIDGVMDGKNYYDTLWDTNLVDTDKTLGHFFTDCAEAGPETCAFHAETAELIESKLNALIASLHKEPVPVVIRPTDGSKPSYGLVDYSMLRSAVFTALYKPTNFPKLAVALEDLRNGNGSALFTMAGGSPEDCGCGPTAFSAATAEAGQAIICTDGLPMEDSLEELKERYDVVWDTISTFGELWTPRIGCSGWKIRAPKRFTGPFIGNTSHPLLVIGNTADPVTPLRSAHKMAKGFSGATVLTQDSPGHCSLSGVSLCTAKFIRQYFANGTLPEAGTVCSVDTKLFPRENSERLAASDDAQIILQTSHGEDQELIEAVKAINERFDVVVQA